jgi:hypothetical protein
MLTPVANKLTINVIGAMIPCQSPPQKPAGGAPGSLYLEFAPATEREFAIAGRSVQEGRIPHKSKVVHKPLCAVWHSATKRPRPRRRVRILRFSGLLAVGGVRFFPDFIIITETASDRARFLPPGAADLGFKATASDLFRAKPFSNRARRRSVFSC